MTIPDMTCNILEIVEPHSHHKVTIFGHTNQLAALKNVKN